MGNNKTRDIFKIQVKSKVGHSKFTLVFVHGNSQNLHLWDHQLKTSLFDAFNRMAFDLPGHGDSMKLDNYQIPFLVPILEDIFNNLGSIVLVGHSLGGHLILQSLPNIANCLGLVLIGTPPLKKPLNLNEAFAQDERMGLLFKDQLSPGEKKSMMDFIGCNNHPVAIGALEKTDPVFRTGIAHSISTGELSNEMDSLKTADFPVAILAGEMDPLVNKEYLNKIGFSTLWKQKVHYIPSSGHTPHLENSKAFNAVINEFVEELLTNGAS
ncbi:alpha/beta fold hydrolase [Flagellimonas algicola]|uniref:Alpha/beta hydrolase n=1 Tax=Flagellimonas algicola TaxID=2583815 RepID=A0ABY2WPC9_9FLAO|nr:alpha/beta hydrolase [Allomuricauda algicola]TMU56851.1 alpha/beta hydrolase [Allomuricauda algicola]